MRSWTRGSSHVAESVQEIRPGPSRAGVEYVQAAVVIILQVPRSSHEEYDHSLLQIHEAGVCGFMIFVRTHRFSHDTQSGSNNPWHGNKGMSVLLESFIHLNA